MIHYDIFQLVEGYHEAAVQQAVSAASLGGASGYASGAASGAASANGSASPETSPSKVKEKDSWGMLDFTKRASWWETSR